MLPHAFAYGQIVTGMRCQNPDAGIFSGHVAFSKTHSGALHGLRPALYCKAVIALHWFDAESPATAQAAQWGGPWRRCADRARETSAMGNDCAGVWISQHDCSVEVRVSLPANYIHGIIMNAMVLIDAEDGLSRTLISQCTSLLNRVWLFPRQRRRTGCLADRHQPSDQWCQISICSQGSQVLRAGH